MKGNVLGQLLLIAPPGTTIPKPEAVAPFKIKGLGKRRGEDALIYYIPNHKNPNKPHEKGITVSELDEARSRLKASGELTKGWFKEHLPECNAEGSCNFTSIGGLFMLLGEAEYVMRGEYRS